MKNTCLTPKQFHDSMAQRWHSGHQGFLFGKDSFWIPWLRGGDGPMVHLGMAHLGTTQNVRMSWRVATFSLLECIGVTFCIFGWLVVGVGMWLAVRKRTWAGVWWSDDPSSRWQWPIPKQGIVKIYEDMLIHFMYFMTQEYGVHKSLIVMYVCWPMLKVLPEIILRLKLDGGDHKIWQCRRAHCCAIWIYLYLKMWLLKHGSFSMYP